MDHIDFNAEARLVVWTTLRDSSASDPGPLVELVSRAIELNRKGIRVELELNGSVLGFGLIEAIYYRPDFPGRECATKKPERAARSAPPTRNVSAWGTGILARLTAATGWESATRAVDGRKRTILLVEDEPLVRMLALDTLTEAGFEVIEASGADEALSLLKSRPDVQLVFTDVNMPGSLNGLQLASHVRSLCPEVKLLIGSGVVRPEADELPESGRFLAKPYRPGAIVQNIEDLLNE